MLNWRKNYSYSTFLRISKSNLWPSGVYKRYHSSIMLEEDKTRNVTSKTSYDFFVSALMKSGNTLEETRNDRRFSNWKRLAPSQLFLQLKQMLLSTGPSMMTHLSMDRQSALASGTIFMWWRGTTLTGGLDEKFRKTAKLGSSLLPLS